MFFRNYFIEKPVPNKKKCLHVTGTSKFLTFEEVVKSVYCLCFTNNVENLQYHQQYLKDINNV